MTKTPTRKKLRKLTVALLAPALALVFLFGWILYWIRPLGQLNAKQPPTPINKIPANKDKIEITAIPQQEKEIPAN